MTGWLTTSDVIELTGYSRTTLWRATARFRQTGGREGLRYDQHTAGVSSLRFRVADVEAWMGGGPGKHRRASPRKSQT